MKQRKIYIASSWKNEKAVLEIGKYLREIGHEVYMFCEEGSGHYCFGPQMFFEETGIQLDTITAKQALSYPQFQKAFEADKAGIDWADTVVILLPAGKSTHLEGGYAVGCGKDLFVLGLPVPGDFDAMYGFAKAVCETPWELKDSLCKATEGSECES